MINVIKYALFFPWQGTPMKETDKAYLAGMVDGEGCISILSQIDKSGTMTYRLIIDVSSTDAGVIHYLHELWGVGAIHITRPNDGRHRDGYHWVVSSRYAADLLATILPYLILKKNQAELALRFQATMRPREIAAGKGVGRYMKTPLELVELRESYKQQLSAMKGYLSKRGRPKKLPGIAIER
jgi:hypothetical protein